MNQKPILKNSKGKVPALLALVALCVAAVTAYAFMVADAQVPALAVTLILFLGLAAAGVAGWMLGRGRRTAASPAAAFRGHSSSEDKVWTELSKTRTEAELFDRIEQLGLINHVGRAIVSILDSDALLFEIVQRICFTFNYYIVDIVIADYEHGELVFKATASNTTVSQEILKKNYRFSINETRGIVGTAFKERRPIAVPDTAREPLYIPLTILPDTRSELALPLVYGDETLGVLNLEDSREGTFTEASIPLFQTLADLAAASLHNAKQFEQLAKAEKNAEEANRLKTKFLAAMTHELRTPLNSIINLAYTSSLELQEKESTHGESLAQIERSGRQLLQLIDNILDYTVLEQGGLVLDFSAVELAPLVRECADLVRDRCASKKLGCAVQIPTAMLVCQADRRRLRQIISLLLDNAVKFTEKGNVGIELEDCEDRVRISVSDTGIGIAPCHRQNIFKAFVQLDANLDRSYPGLGLTLAHWLIEKHGSRLEVSSTPGAGSCFYFELKKQ